MLSSTFRRDHGSVVVRAGMSSSKNTKNIFLKKKCRIIKNPVCPKLHSFVEYLQIKPLTSDGKIPLVIIAKHFFFVTDVTAKKLVRLSPTTSSFRLVL
jgi:hypothetical protein